MNDQKKKFLNIFGISSVIKLVLSNKDMILIHKRVNLIMLFKQTFLVKHQSIFSFFSFKWSFVGMLQT